MKDYKEPRWWDDRDDHHYTDADVYAGFLAGFLLATMFAIFYFTA